MPLEPKTNSQLHGLLTKSKMMREKGSLILEITNGRTSHSSELTETEAKQLIQHLQARIDSSGPFTHNADHLRKTILSICHQMEWYSAPGKLDFKRIDDFCINRGHYKKSLNEHSYKELIELVAQFKRVLTNHKKKLNEQR